MIVPGDQAAGSDISVDYVITHEYGHHIAAHRSNAPLNALDFGPKRWSSYELVCSNTLDGKLAPADEGANYLSNPGEAWAEAYARLVFPTEAWRFTPVLKPTQGSALAAMADVAQPWTKRVTTTFKGTDTKTFKPADHARRRLHPQARRPGHRELRPDRAVGRQGRGPHHPPGLPGLHQLQDRLPRPPDRDPEDHGHPAIGRQRRALHAHREVRGLSGARKVAASSSPTAGGS